MENEKKFTGPAYEFEAKMPLKQAIPLGLQHVFAMFVGNLTPLLIIMEDALPEALEEPEIIPT